MLCPLLGWVAFGPTSYAACRASSVSRLSTGDFWLAEQLARMYQTDVADVQLLDKGHPVADTQVIDVIK